MYFRCHDIKTKQMIFLNQIFVFGPMDGSCPDGMLKRKVIININNVAFFFGKGFLARVRSL